ncbi:MAG: hypothetical protein WCY72_02530 [Lysobacteraceae bacterium]
MSQTRHLFDTAKRLAPAKLSEVIDFAEYLEQRQPTDPATHALESYSGHLEEVPPFTGIDPLAAQREQRGECGRGDVPAARWQLPDQTAGCDASHPPAIASRIR